ncbi:MAG: tol-pal system protein YbgF [Deltaproteobacteria bacterium]|nr:tol-pal system protein YbgF [Deltaproteobacteria bacterium]
MGTDLKSVPTQVMGFKIITKNKTFLLLSALLLLYGCVPPAEQEAMQKDIASIREEFGKKNITLYNDVEGVRTRQDKTEKSLSEIRGEVELHTGKISSIIEDFKTQQSKVENDIADIRKEVGTHSQVINTINGILEDFKARHDKTDKEIAGIKKDIDLQNKLVAQVADELRREKAVIFNSLDEIKIKMSHLEGRFDESKFDAQKAKDSIESVQAKSADKKETLDKFAAIQTTLASMEKRMSSDKKELIDEYTAVQNAIQTKWTALERQLSAQNEKVKTIEEKASLLENDIKQQKESITNILEKESKKPAAMSEQIDPKTLYEEGRKYVMEEKGFNKGIEILRNFIKIFPEHELADNAQYWIGEAYDRQKDYERAVLEYNEVIKRYPKGNKVPAAMVKQGMAFYKLGNKEEAKILLERVKSKYPDTDEASLANKKLEEMK